MIREMTLADALHVIARMRESDRRALAAVCPGMTPEQFAMDRFGTDHRYTVTATDGEPVVIGGARMLTTGTAMLWMVATPRIAEIPKAVMRVCRRFVGAIEARRLEGSYLAGETVCARFAARFGLEFEGVRRGAGAHGEDIVMVGRLHRG
jgi:hypothetical protein